MLGFVFLVQTLRLEGNVIFIFQERIVRKILLLALSITLSGCLGMPETVKPVDEFNLQNYLGKWYEIARLDHSFEAGLTQVTAQYTLKDDGGVAVLNKGFLADENQWKEAEGKAYFVNGDSEGYLKVSFFGPFYGSYVVFALDKTDYQYAFVSGPNTDYLWLLARTPTVDQSLIDTFVAMAKERGFDTERLIFVEQK
ncbi:lipoprotein Blc [Vibrio vulnificus]|uniref:Outer membrane lipoprotein Blc n=1 Tax=Vibrio vulnificus TaxID=672 RepID=A0AAN1PSN1_VIBVL|nr:lipoprotein Blc [Vibrio vulnificus]AXX61611.1 lipoprotein Blc [Vibrio vulnificus]